MPRTRPAAIGATVAAFVVLAGTSGVLAGTPSAAAQSAADLEFTVVFDDLVPGETRTATETLDRAREGTLVSFTWVERTGILADGELDALACSSAGVCTSVTDFASIPFAAGTATVTVSVTASADVAPGAAGSAIGRLVFTGDDALPTTGDTVRGALWAAALLIAGAAALAWAHRRPKAIP